MQIIKKALCVIEDGTPTGKEVAYALLFVRIAIGVFFITHGYGKLFGDAPGMEGFTGMLVMMGVPAAGLFAWLVAIAEFFGGLAILVGAFTRFSAFWLAIISFVAWVKVKGFSLGMVMIMENGMPMGGGDLDLLALGMTLAILFAGPGMYSVSYHLDQKKK